MPFLKRYTTQSLLVLALAGPIVSCGGEETNSATPPAPAAPVADLPVAGPNPALPTGAAITRFAIGSCNGQEQAQAVWSAVAASDPQLFIAMGDNVYGDIGWDGSPGLETFIAAYEMQSGSAPFTDLRREVPMLATWDDHDYGPNDSGGSFAYRELSEDLFESFWNAPADVRGRPGVYHSVTVGPQGRRVQFILLDTRFFRSGLATLPESTPLGGYAPTSDRNATVLGPAQWAWLRAELAEPADLRVLVSSIQVLTEAHNFESWANFPAERSRLLDALNEREGGGVLLLSGDRHAAGFYEIDDPALAEFTSSSLNRPIGAGSAVVSQLEPDPKRIGPLTAEANFGLVEIDWPGRELAMRIMDAGGAPVRERTLAF